MNFTVRHIMSTSVDDLKEELLASLQRRRNEDAGWFGNFFNTAADDSSNSNAGRQSGQLQTITEEQENSQSRTPDDEEVFTEEAGNTHSWIPGQKKHGVFL